MATIFISYRRDVSAGYAGRLHEELEQRLGQDQVFRDADTLRPGQDFVEAIGERLRECRACIVLIAPGWLEARAPSGERRLDQTGDYVSMEIAGALARPGVLVIPVLAGGAAMPEPAQLPEALRPLARRQALVIRDETWETDMDRLSAILRAHTGGGHAVAAQRARSVVRPRTRAAAGVIALALVAILVWARRPEAPVQDAVGATQTARSGVATGVGDLAGSNRGAVHAIEVPRRGAEVALGELIYTLLAGSVRADGGMRTIWLRVRASNEGRYDANLWDDSFRLEVDGKVHAPTSGLNELLPRHALQQVVVRFEIPAGSPKAVLHIDSKGKTGALPLDLASTGGAPRHDDPDAGDALSRATLASLVADPAPLVEAGGLSATLVRATMRRFANTIRIIVTVRIANTGRYARSSGDLVLRLVHGGDVSAPVVAPNDVIEADSTATGDSVFEVPPATRDVVLRATTGGTSATLPLRLR